MKYGVREICDVVFKAKDTMKIGSETFVKGQPVLLIDTAKTSSMEGSSSTNYAQGGRGNARLLAWEGDKALTFSVEDALLSPVGFAILSGAGLFKGAANSSKKVHFHKGVYATITAGTNSNVVIDLSQYLLSGETVCSTAPIFVCNVEQDDSGSISGGFISGWSVTDGITLTKTASAGGSEVGTKVFVDFYILKSDNGVNEIQIDAKQFGGYFYVEASTLFKDKATGTDLPAELTFPNVKIQSNFTFQMASTGDPSTFNFVMDAFPGYTRFDSTHEVLCAIQIADSTPAGTTTHESVMGHTEVTQIAPNDSVVANG